MVNIYHQYQMMKQNHLIVSYSGTLNGELIASLLQLSDAKLKEQQVNVRKKKNIINILIECLQNIFYHSEMELPALKECILMLSKQDDEYVIYTGNYLRQDRAKVLQAKLEKINPLSQEEIHQLYLATLDSGQISAKGGAGLGILRIIRESGQKLEYAIENIDNEHAFLGLQIKIGSLCESA
ncbi:hypothetical protein SAMN05421780_107136 [Flexibacter flexilis DSM 6793]|uniref:GHKL domain-containing protein n=2 Tax=Flexibacter flexilis TaxID=998 RepID=A0A1I1KVJ0_9BACT|nr:hypothetical protein SAMN05421780_107136 [Flexibacter flexilis DSM 6793]